jgi:hypothetical protein
MTKRTYPKYRFEPGLQPKVGLGTLEDIRRTKPAHPYPAELRVTEAISAYLKVGDVYGAFFEAKQLKRMLKALAREKAA